MGVAPVSFRVAVKLHADHMCTSGFALVRLRCEDVCRRAKQDCNVFIYCPAAGSCDTGGGKFPYQGCQLKRQPALNASSQPEFWGRGPGTGFTSGEHLS